MAMSFIRIWIKYALTGLAPSLLELGLLFILVEYGHWHYLLASVLTYGLSFIISFLLRRYLVFTDSASRTIIKQTGWYALFFIFNILLNVCLMYVLVERAEIYYLLAQVVVNSVAGLVGFTFNRFVTFKAVSHFDKNR